MKCTISPMVYGYLLKLMVIILIPLWKLLVPLVWLLANSRRGEATDLSLCLIHDFGVPLLHDRASKRQYECIIEKIREKLLGWKAFLYLRASTYERALFRLNMSSKKVSNGWLEIGMISPWGRIGGVWTAPADDNNSWDAELVENLRKAYTKCGVKSWNDVGLERRLPGGFVSGKIDPDFGVLPFCSRISRREIGFPEEFSHCSTKSKKKKMRGLRSQGALEEDDTGFCDNCDSIMRLLANIRRGYATDLSLCLTHDLGHYLGVPLLHDRASKRRYEYIIEKIKKILSGWKANSFMGRNTLVQSLTATIPTRWSTASPYLRMNSLLGKWIKTAVQDHAEELELHIKPHMCPSSETELKVVEISGISEIGIEAWEGNEAILLAFKAYRFSPLGHSSLLRFRACQYSILEDLRTEGSVKGLLCLLEHRLKPTKPGFKRQLFSPFQDALIFSESIKVVEGRGYEKASRMLEDPCLRKLFIKMHIWHAFVLLFIP
ncbi:hypothetical protein RHSIM_Rhsim02G0095600 [Rhododendron simsii]|uniref:Uncharacterized protein n=1 Tax=Rhododendron simsii TaxID=118357 RepID=A0A834HFQ8_RHOSS|nr:hypothetical protein RHSIM_Rhsim02G0095600 [Rhododendron simsii]